MARNGKPRALPEASHSWPKDSLHYTPRASLVIGHKAKMSPIIYTSDSFISIQKINVYLEFNFLGFLLISVN